MIMKITDKLILEYLHDAIVREISFVTNENGIKDLVITAKCDEDCGYEEWAGKAVAVTLSSVLLASAILLGHVAGEDIVQSFREGLSATSRQRIAEMRDIGISIPNSLLTLVLQSGSEIEIACDDVDITVI
jgi:hypothetical protein